MNILPTPKGIIENKKCRMENILEAMRTPVTIKQISIAMNKPFGSFLKEVNELIPEFAKKVGSVRIANGRDAALYQAHLFEYTKADSDMAMYLDEKPIAGAKIFLMQDKAGKERYARNQKVRKEALKKKPYYGASGSTLNASS